MPPVVAAIGVLAVKAGAFAGSALWAFSYSVWAKVAAWAVTIGGSLAYSSYAKNKAQKKMAAAMAQLDQGRDVTVRDPVAPRRIVYGQVLVGGPIVFAEVSGTSNEFLYLVVKLADHECEELGDIYFDDAVVPLDGSGNATGTYAGYATVRKYRGLVAGERDTTLETDSGGEWTANHLGKSVARLHIKLKHNPDLFPQGIPNIRCLVKGRKVYDFRTATTAYSNNPALCVADYLMDARYGKAVAQARINSTAVQAAANICDESVNLNPSGTESRYTCNGIVSSDEDPNDILASLAECMAGVVVDAGGTWTIHAGAYRTPTLTLTDDDLAAGFSVAPRLSRQDTFNGVRGAYYSPENQWAAADFPAVINDTYKADDGGTRLWRDVAYRFTTSSATAQRLAKIELERGRQQIVIQGRYMLKAMQCQPGDNIRITRSRLGWTNKVFEVTAWRFVVENSAENPVLAVEITARETASGVWDWSSGEQTIVDLAPNTTLINPRAAGSPAGLTLTSSFFEQEDGTIFPRLRVQWTQAALEQVKNGGSVSIEYKKAADSTWLVWNTLRGDTTEDYITDVLIGTSYNVRFRFRNTFGVFSDYSSTATATPTGDTTPPGTVSGLTANGGAGFIALLWTPIDRTTYPDFAEYRVYRGTTNVFGSATAIADVSASTFIDTTAVVATTYYYWVAAIDRSENIGTQSGVVSAAATAPINTATPSTPSAPTFNAEATYLAGDGTAFAYVTINTPALSTGSIVLDVLYRVSGSSSWLIADQVNAAGTVRIDDLATGTAYEFAVRGVSNGGTLSAVSSVLSRTTPTDSSAPAEVTGLVAESGAGFISLAWDATNKTTYPDFSEYLIYRGTTNVFGSSAIIASVAANAFIDADVVVGTTYYYWIRAVDTSENAGVQSSLSSAAATQPISVVAPSTPSAPTYSSEGTYLAGDGTVFAFVVVSTPALASGAIAMDVLYRVSGSSSWLIANQVTGATTSRIDDLSPNVAYEFAMRAISNGGALSAVSSVLSRTAPDDGSAPATPTGLSATVGTGQAVSLDWNDNTESDLGEYGVYRNTANDAGTATKIAEVLASRFVDVDVSLGTTYYYWVSAIDRSENESAKSTGTSATPAAITQGSVNTTAPSTPSAPTFVSETTYVAGDGSVFARITIAAPALPSGAIGVNILYRRSGASDWLVGAQVTGAGNVSIDDLSPDIAYEFAARAFSFSGALSSVSSTLSRTSPVDTTPPPEVTGLAAAGGTGYISLTWDAIDRATTPDLAEYLVLRGTTNVFGSAAVIANVGSNAYVDADVTPGTTYYYWARAVDRTNNAGTQSNLSSASANAAGATITRASGTDNAGLNSGGQTTIASLSKTAATSLVSGNVTVENLDTIADSGVTVRVYRDSTVIYTLPNFNMASLEIDGPVAFSVTDNPGSGTYTYAVKAYRTVSGATISVSADFAAVG